MTSISIAAYLLLFGTVALLFLLFALCLGRLLRPSTPTGEKLETYECGEPAIGSSFVQFNLRFYVVALVFIIFEVEMAFFFPWATVFGKVTQLLNPHVSADIAAQTYDQLVAQQPAGSGVVDRNARDIHAAASGGHAVAARAYVSGSPVQHGVGSAVLVEEMRALALASMADIAVFFAVLLVGFAYVWHRGDLDWVRTVTQVTQR
jgi:NADH-quinone oxidoreductase subunit A